MFILAETRAGAPEVKLGARPAGLQAIPGVTKSEA